MHALEGLMRLLKRLHDLWFAGEHDLSGVRERFILKIKTMKGRK